ncbi:N-glycosidase R617 [Geodia barretti]|uniref:N-glycosidase R617 n=1 Tax=Geodia barretti TaxID=519541 RepID=A0AA35X7I3_GEOBA|nr:N-glycosidase R617 [Geodia barretti]
MQRPVSFELPHTALHLYNLPFCILLSYLLLKFSQNDDLRAELMKTRGTTLVEAAPGDTVWGIGLSATNWKAQHRQRWRGKKSVG